MLMTGGRIARIARRFVDNFLAPARIGR